MKTNIILKLSLVFSIALLFQGCDTQGTMGVNPALAAVQQLLTTGSNDGFSVLGNAQTFASNALIDAAMPAELKNINTKLESLGLNSLVDKEKQYIGQAASQTVSIAQPIVTKAIEQMTMEDAIGIVAGGKGAATKYLKDKTSAQLFAAIQPKVDEQLQSTGITTLLNNATKGSNVLNTLSSLLGGGNATSTATNTITGFATQQMIDGLFNVIENHENSLRSNPSSVLGDLLK